MKAGRPHQKAADDLDLWSADPGLAWAYTERQLNGSQPETPPLPPDPPSPGKSSKRRHDRRENQSWLDGAEEWLLRLLAVAIVAALLIGLAAWYIALAGQPQ